MKVRDMDVAPSRAVAGAASIFYVEDDDDIRLFVSIILEKAGYRMEMYPDGSTAAEAIRASNAAAYVFDVRMPGQSGVQLCKLVRSILPGHPPVLMVSAEADPDNIAEALAAGADLFLRKPFTRRQLLDALDGLLHPPDSNVA